MKQALGITEAVWEEMQAARPGSHDLDQSTAFYIDVYVAWELGMRYPTYIQQTTPQERLLYQLFLSLKAMKERHAQERAQEEADIAREMSMPGGPPVRQ